MSILGVLFVVLGLALLGIVLFQSSLSLVTSFRQFSADTLQRDLGIKLLRNKIEAMKSLYVDYEDVKKNSWVGFRKFKTKLKKEGGGITSCYLYPHDGKKLPSFKPGQYLTFQLRVPGEEKPLIRCYSLSESPREDYFRVSVKKVPPPRDKPELPPGKSSTYFNDILKDDDLLDVKVPGGAFFLETKEQTPIVLIGGGIGITPVYSMLRTLVDEDSDREVWFFYGVRNGKEAVYKEELREIAKTRPNVKMNICYSSPADGDKEGVDYQQNSRVTVELFKQLLPSNNFEFYICGPPPMMQTIVPDLENWGVPSKRVKFEAFGPATVKKKKPKVEEKSTDTATADSGFKVKFAQSGKEVSWSSDCDSILELADDNDVALPSGCRIGNCGTCMTAVKSGEFEYDDEPSFEADAGSCLACIAKPKGNLELDA